ncbi:four helix bundle protein [Nibrella viscosa]|uniref:Four helix bundle protein n=1 Tax=Nibrella viscosa TaxID=1084524 RepID=A0ABP8KM37_9BACT
MKFVVMATLQRFEELKAWQKARELAQDVYRITSVGAFVKDYDLRSQFRRSSGSVMDNIAEGFERGGRGEFIQFLGIAKGSAGEVRSQLYRAFDQKYITEDEFHQQYQTAEQISRMITSLITYLNRTEYKGNKYNVSEEQADYNFKLQTSNFKP